MKILILFSVFVIAVFAGSRGVIELDEVSWGSIVDGTKDVLVSFDEFKWKDPKVMDIIVNLQDFHKVAEEFKGDKVVVAKVDCSSNSELKSKYGAIEKYPTFMLFPKGSDKPLT
jgi:hypothetical protein